MPPRTQMGHGHHGHHGAEGREGRFRGGKGRPEGGRERMFEQGGIKLLVLSLLSEQPRHGYEIIKAVEDLAGGEYTPSPGVIYPTLTMLEEMGLTEVLDAQGGKKQYRVTAAGETYLAEQKDSLERIRGRLGATGTRAEARKSPELQRAMQNFKMSLRLRLDQENLDGDVFRKIAEIIDRAAVEIERS